MLVYLTTNLINGKLYVGQTTRDDKNYLGSGVILNNAINKYGKENFKRTILITCSSQEELNEQEMFWIDVLNTVTPNGYNLKTGGGAGSEYSEKSKQLMSEARLGKSLEELGHKLNCQCPFCKASRGETKGENAPHYNKPHTEKSKRKNRDAHKKENLTEETIRKMIEAKLGKSLEEQGHKPNCQCCGCKAARGELKGENAPHYNKHHSEKTKQKMSESSKGENNPRYGQHHSEETKQKMKGAWVKRKKKLGIKNGN